LVKNIDDLPEDALPESLIVSEYGKDFANFFKARPGFRNTFPSVDDQSPGLPVKGGIVELPLKINTVGECIVETISIRNLQMEATTIAACASQDVFSSYDGAETSGSGIMAYVGAPGGLHLGPVYSYGTTLSPAYNVALPENGGDVVVPTSGLKWDHNWKGMGDTEPLDGSASTSTVGAGFMDFGSVLPPSSSNPGITIKVFKNTQTKLCELSGNSQIFRRLVKKKDLVSDFEPSLAKLGIGIIGYEADTLKELEAEKLLEGGNNRLNPIAENSKMRKGGLQLGNSRAQRLAPVIRNLLRSKTLWMGETIIEGIGLETKINGEKLFPPSVINDPKYGGGLYIPEMTTKTTKQDGTVTEVVYKKGENLPARLKPANADEWCAYMGKADGCELKANPNGLFSPDDKFTIFTDRKGFFGGDYSICHLQFAPSPGLLGSGGQSQSTASSGAKYHSMILESAHCIRMPKYLGILHPSGLSDCNYCQMNKQSRVCSLDLSSSADGATDGCGLDLLDLSAVQDCDSDGILDSTCQRFHDPAKESPKRGFMSLSSSMNPDYLPSVSSGDLPWAVSSQLSGGQSPAAPTLEDMISQGNPQQ